MATAKSRRRRRVSQGQRRCRVSDGWGQSQHRYRLARHENRHASNYISDAAKALFGEGTPEAKAWLEQGRQSLLADGWYGICAHIGAALATENTPVRQTAVAGLTSYLAKHTEHLNYRLRLHQGRSIGSGMVEGAAKNMIGKRLKQTGARWKVVNANKMAELCCLNYSSQWEIYWNAA